MPVPLEQWTKLKIADSIKQSNFIRERRQKLPCAIQSGKFSKYCQTHQGGYALLLCKVVRSKNDFEADFLLIFASHEFCGT